MKLWHIWIRRCYKSWDFSIPENPASALENVVERGWLVVARARAPLVVKPSVHQGKPCRSESGTASCRVDAGDDISMSQVCGSHLRRRSEVPQTLAYSTPRTNFIWQLQLLWACYGIIASPQRSRMAGACIRSLFYPSRMEVCPTCCYRPHVRFSENTC